MDTTVVIHLIRAERLDLLGSVRGWNFVVPDQVVAEVTYPEQAGALERALEQAHLRRESSTDPAEIALYAELRERMGKGEAACLAMAATRGWMMASDDRGRAFQRLVRERIGPERIMNTVALARLAHAQGLLSADDAQHLEDIATS